jgi:hypothetical protein
LTLGAARVFLGLLLLELLFLLTLASTRTLEFRACLVLRTAAALGVPPSRLLRANALTRTLRTVEEIIVQAVQELLGLLQSALCLLELRPRECELKIDDICCRLSLEVCVDDDGQLPEHLAGRGWRCQVETLEQECLGEEFLSPLRQLRVEPGA